MMKQGLTAVACMGLVMMMPVGAGEVSVIPPSAIVSPPVVVIPTIVPPVSPVAPTVPAPTPAPAPAPAPADGVQGPADGTVAPEDAATTPGETGSDAGIGDGGIIPPGVSGIDVQSMSTEAIVESIALVDQALSAENLQAVDNDALRNLKARLEQELSSR